MNFLSDTTSPLPSQLLLCSLYEIYQALEEEMDRNSDHPGVAPIYFPAELARLKAIEKDLEYFYGQDWREKIVVPAATKRYCHRLRQVCFIITFIVYHTNTIASLLFDPEITLHPCFVLFFRLEKKTLNFWLPTLTHGT